MVMLRLAVALGAAAVLAMPAAAVPISYIFAGTAVGTLDGQTFSGALTVTASGDTADVTPLSGNKFVNGVVSTVIDIVGLGSVSVTGDDAVFVAQNSTKIGYNVQGLPICCDIIQFQNPEYATYDLVSAIGPIPFGSDLSIAAWGDVPTSGGLLTVTSFTDNTFRAVVDAVDVPETGALAILACGLLGLALSRPKLG
jgi:hypothetical protein